MRTKVDTEELIVPPPGTLGVWVDIRPLARYPAVRATPARAVEARPVAICRSTILAWRQGMVSEAELRATRKRIQQAALAAADCDPLTPLPPLEPPAEKAPEQPEVPQDEFLSALAAVFG